MFYLLRVEKSQEAILLSSVEFWNTQGAGNLGLVGQTKPELNKWWVLVERARAPSGSVRTNAITLSTLRSVYQNCTTKIEIITYAMPLLWHVPIFVKGELCLLFDFFRDIVCFFSLFEDLCLFISRNVFSCTTQPESSGCECVARVATPGRQLPVKSPYTKTHLNIHCNNYNVIQMNPIVCLALTFKGLFS